MQKSIVKTVLTNVSNNEQRKNNINRAVLMVGTFCLLISVL